MNFNFALHITPWTMILKAGGFKGGHGDPCDAAAASASSQQPAHKQYCGIPTGLTLRWMPSPRSTDRAAESSIQS